MARALLWLCPLVLFVGCSSSNAPDDGTDGGGTGPGSGAGTSGGTLSDSGADAASPIDGAAPTDAGGDAAAKGGCAGSTLKMCEDFDTSTVGQIPTGWTALKGYANPAVPTLVASDDFHSPPNSVKTSSSVAGADRIMKSLAGLGGTTAGTHWGRVFWKVKSPAPHPKSNGQGPHAPFVALQGNLRAGDLRVVDTQQQTTGKIQLLVNTPDDQCCGGTDFTYTIWDGNWHCSEWYVDHVTQSYRYFLDSTEVTSIGFDYGAGSTKANMPAAFTAVGLGAYFFADLQSQLVTWFDDLAIDDKQIGCK